MTTTSTKLAPCRAAQALWPGIARILRPAQPKKGLQPRGPPTRTGARTRSAELAAAAGRFVGCANSLKWGETWKHGAHTSDRSLSESACMPASSWSPPKPWAGPSMCLQGRTAGCQGAASGIRSACASAVTAATAAAATATAAADPTPHCCHIHPPLQQRWQPTGRARRSCPAAQQACHCCSPLCCHALVPALALRAQQSQCREQLQHIQC